MPESVFGLPVHPLVVHATVVLVPLTALVLALAVSLPRFRAWAGWLPLGLAVVSVVLAPVSTVSGESFEDLLGLNPDVVERHRELGAMLIWWCLGMLVVAAALTVVHRRPDPPARAVSLGLTVAGVAVAVGTVVMVVLIGHSGADAAWGGLVPA
jgi:uncharacterized membrane protein